MCQQSINIVRFKMPKTPLKLAIVGCGAVVDELHLPSLRRLVRQGAVRVTALVDRSQERLRHLKRALPGAACFDDATTALESARADVALVASPPGLHRVHVEAALLNGCHVLCEKPLATSVRQVTELAELAERLKLILMVGLTRRFFPSLATADSVLRSGELGGHVELSLLRGQSLSVAHRLRRAFPTGGWRRRSIDGQGRSCAGLALMVIRANVRGWGRG